MDPCVMYSFCFGRHAYSYSCSFSSGTAHLICDMSVGKTTGGLSNGSRKLTSQSAFEAPYQLKLQAHPDARPFSN